MAGWKELRDDLRRINRESPGALSIYPDPRDDLPDEAPLSIGLAAWAEGIAAELHERHGDFVELQVGAMSYPDRRLLAGDLALQLPGSPATSAGLDVEPAAALRVRTGRSTRESVTVKNRSAQPHALHTNGQLQSAVVDDAGRVVGRYVGPQQLPFVVYSVEPSRAAEVPVLIGTDSLSPELGYAVPPGRWHLVVELRTAEGDLVSAPLPLAVTE